MHLRRRDGGGWMRLSAGSVQVQPVSLYCTLLQLDHRCSLPPQSWGSPFPFLPDFPLQAAAKAPR